MLETRAPHPPQREAAPARWTPRSPERATPHQLVLGALLLALGSGCDAAAAASPALEMTADAAIALDPAAAESDAASAPDSAGDEPSDQQADSAGQEASADSAAPERDARADEGADASSSAPDAADLPYARSVVRFTPGAHAGFGQEHLPDVVLGPPMGQGDSAASLDVLSLGVGGEIVLAFGELELSDGPGPDLIVFENPFWPGGDASRVFAEPGEVALSADGETWSAFPCDPAGTRAGQFPGCAGWTPTAAYDAHSLLPPDPQLTGGDAFDLGALGLSSARFVRIRDLSASGAGTSAGFDLDAVALIHYTQPAR